MSLTTDYIFVKALQNDESLMQSLPAGNVYNTSIALPDEELDNAPIPYVIVSFDGLTNDQSTKDTYEGDTDQTTVSIIISAKSREQLGELAQTVRRDVREFFEQCQTNGEYEDMLPLDYRLSAQGVQYDQLKPCYWQTLTYQCDDKNI